MKVADEFGSWCPQPDLERRGEGESYSGEGWAVFENIPVNENSAEDCLTLNIWSPAAAKDNPVKGVIHGNG